jgi:ribonuclease Z
MSIAFQVLGSAGGDNALFVQIDSGHAIERLLFDCGEGCVSGLPFSDLQGIDHLFFSHLHMDHIGGFDSFFRGVFDRETKPNRIWGPPETAAILQHRFQGYLWNLHTGMSATWRVSDVHPDEIRTARFELHEAFATAHDEGVEPRVREVWEICQGIGFTVEAVTMDHRTPTLAYVVREKTRRNIDNSRLAALGLRPGPWLKEFKESHGRDEETLTIDGATHSLEELRRALMTETPGDSIAYLTDFLLDEPSIERLVEALRGCRVMICEGQYRHADLALAQKHFHTTTTLAATVARRAQVEELVLFHISVRYERAEWIEMLREARQIFPRTHYPAHWKLEHVS